MATGASPAETTSPAPRPGFRFSLRTLLGAVAAIAVLMWIVRSYLPQTGYSATAAECPIPDLPADATDIHWYWSGFFGTYRAYEFHTSEESFRAWQVCNPFDVAWRPDGPLRIHRYTAHTVVDDGPETVEINRGFSYSRDGWNGGFSTAYDSDTGWAYRESWPRGGK